MNKRFAQRVMGLPRFEDWLKDQMKDPDFRSGYEREGLAVRLAYRIQCLREDRGLTQRQMAGRMGTTQQVISRLESGTYHGITLRTLQRLAAAVEGELVVEIRTVGRRSKPDEGTRIRKRRHAG